MNHPRPPDQRARELLKECMIVLGVKSEYALAKKLNIKSQRINDYMHGKRLPTNYALIKIANCLKIDGLNLIAEFECKRARNLEERTYWEWLLACDKETKRIHQGQALQAWLENKGRFRR